SWSCSTSHRPGSSLSPSLQLAQPSANQRSVFSMQPGQSQTCLRLSIFPPSLRHRLPRAAASRSRLRASTHSSSSEISQPTERGPRWIGLGANPAFCKSYQVEVGTPVSSYRCASRATPLGLLVCIGPSRFGSRTVVYFSHDLRVVE